MSASQNDRNIPPAFGVFRRRFGDILLFGVTSTELAILSLLTPSFTITDWIYVLQHIIVLAIALTRRPPKVADHSRSASIAVLVAYTYPYAQLIYLRRTPGHAVWPAGGFILVTLAAVLSLASLLALGRLFGIRPALRGLMTRGPYGFVRHPMYLAYMVGDIGYNLQEWNFGTVVLVIAGWVALIHRIHAEEQILADDERWPRYVCSVRYRLLPGLW
jgi:protein-S-isoprenylcysteine O-methyltransferase Ste14